NSENNGVVRQRAYPPVRFADIAIGTTQALMVADKRLGLKNLGQHQSDDNEGYTAGWDWDTIRSGYLQPLPDGPTNAVAHFGSSHPGGINAVFADGSVRGISYAIDVVTFGHLCNINGGKVITNDY